MLRLFTSCFFLFCANRVWAFPENVRHGYFNCTACHVSPSGGGVLTPYGRSLSAELMSTWGSAKTSGFFFTDNENASINPPWLRSNIFFRGVQTWRNSPVVEKAQFIPMRGDFEGGVDTEKFAVIAALGFRARDNSSTNLNELFSRSHYLLYRISDNLNVRLGKFLFAFGLGGPDHITATRRGLGWDQGSESYNLEVSFLGEKSNTIITAISNVPQEKGVTKDGGFSVTQNFLLREHSKVGINLYSGEQGAYQRYVYGPSWVLSFSDRLFLNSEVFGQSKKLKDTGQTKNGYATYHRLNYQVVKGFVAFVQSDRSFLDNKTRETCLDTYGGGVQWLPYPHLEVVSYYGKEKAYSQMATDFAWLMMHVYL